MADPLSSSVVFEDPFLRRPIMNPKNDRPQLEGPATTERLAAKKRFRIRKLEERIAPTRGGKGTHNCSSDHGSRSAP